MKKIFLMSAAFAAMIFASCSKETGGEGPDVQGQDSGVAYLSIKVDTRQGTRASGENEGANESDLNKLYMVTFDAAGKVVAVPGKTSGVGYNMVDAASLGTYTMKDPQAVKVSSASKNLVVVANPGPKLTAVLEGLIGGSTFEAFNAAIAGVNTDEIKGAADVGFAMITGGSDAGLNAKDRILYPYVAIGDKIKVVTATADATPEAVAAADAAAKEAAEDSRLSVKLERLVSKVVVNTLKPKINTPSGVNFEFINWTVDAVNSTFHPFAEKTLLGVAHTPDADNDYAKNFYTRDPNFSDNAGIKYATTGADFAPILPWGDAANKNGYYGWKGDAAIAYVIENTMAAAEQKFGNATRIVIRGKYFPDGFATNSDWFSWAGTDYKSLADLKKAYGEASASGALKDACDRFYTELNGAFDDKITAEDFAHLTPEELADIPNGGEVVKQGNTPVILWYQKGLCYYYYELRHDNVTTAEMAFGKYGAVRNNWYALEVRSVSNPGTPWYPDIDNPGPGDPDPKDPIDAREGYLGISVSINKWIIWETGIDF